MDVREHYRAARTAWLWYNWPLATARCSRTVSSCFFFIRELARKAAFTAGHIRDWPMATSGLTLKEKDIAVWPRTTARSAPLCGHLWVVWPAAYILWSIHWRLVVDQQAHRRARPVDSQNVDLEEFVLFLFSLYLAPHIVTKEMNYRAKY